MKVLRRRHVSGSTGAWSKLGVVVPLALSVLALGACSGDGRADEQHNAGVSEDLLTPTEAFSDDVTVSDDRLELPLRGHDDVLGFAKGKILVGAPNLQTPDSAKNPYGFLRRVEGVERQGDLIVIHTSPAELTDAFKGEVTLDNQGGMEPVAVTGESLDPQADWSGSFTKRIELPAGKQLFKKQIESAGTAWGVDIKLNHGFLEFVPKISTSIQLSGGGLKQVKVQAEGNLSSEVMLDVDVTASDAAGGGPSPGQHFDVDLHSWPRQRWMQWVGFVPVWEALEVKLTLSCDVKVRGELHGGVGFTANAGLAAGGEYTKDHGMRPILDGPHFNLSPKWDVQVAGNVNAKCAVLPNVALYIYDLAGPILSLGPWVDASIATQVSGGPAWALQPGFFAEFGGRAAIFGHTLFDERVTLVDRPFGNTFTGTF